MTRLTKPRNLKPSKLSKPNSSHLRKGKGKDKVDERTTSSPPLFNVVSAMDCLPIELIQLICAAMPQRDLANFRLACKAFAEIGAKPMVETLHLMILPKSFDNLYNISRIPSLSRWVRTIYYEATTLELFEYDEWKERLPTAEGAPPMPEHPGYPLTQRARRLHMRKLRAWDMEYGPGSRFTQEELENAWESYRDILDATDEIEICYGDFAAMNNVFRHFPNLKAIEFNTTQSPSETMKAAFASTLVAPGPANNLDRELASALSLRYLTPLLLALIHTGVKLTSFKAEEISWNAFLRPLDPYHYIRPSKGPSVEFPCQIDPQELSPALRNLRQLHLVFEPEFEPEMIPPVGVVSEQAVLRQVLKSVTRLEDLRLAFNEPYSHMELPSEQVLLSNLCGNVYWPNLTSLELCSLRVTENYLVDLLQRHSATLKTLKLTSMHLNEGHWASAFQRMRAHLNLDEVAFHETFINVDDMEDETIDDDSEDPYLDMYRPFIIYNVSSRGSMVPLGERLEKYFLEEGYRCPLETKDQKARRRTEREKAYSMAEKGECSWADTWMMTMYKDGLKSC